MKKHFKRQLDILNGLYETFDDKASSALLVDSIEALKRGNSIVATALGKNVPVCEKFVGTLNSLSLRARFMHTNSAIHGDLGMVSDGDLIIVLSKSGETEETIQLLKLLKGRKVKKWLLTCKPNSRAEKLADDAVVLDIGHEGDPWNLVPNSSSIAFLVFLQALSMEMLDALSIPLDHFKRNHPGGDIGRVLKKNGKN